MKDTGRPKLCGPMEAWEPDGVGFGDVGPAEVDVPDGPPLEVDPSEPVVGPFEPVEALVDPPVGPEPDPLTPWDEPASEIVGTVDVPGRVVGVVGGVLVGGDVVGDVLVGGVVGG